MKKLLLVITLLLAGYSQLNGEITGEFLAGWNMDKEHCSKECIELGYSGECRVEWRTTGNNKRAVACLCSLSGAVMSN